MRRVTVVEVRDLSNLELVQQLKEFERQFCYPLGKARTFSISHGDQYNLFFQAMGESSTFVADVEGEVAGVVSVVMKDVQLSDGSTISAAYICDLKVAQPYRGGRVLMSLLERAQSWIRVRCEKAFSIVMDGTPVTPDRYTGRRGIPAFEKVASIALLQVVSRKVPGLPIRSEATMGDVKEVFRRLASGSTAIDIGEPVARSMMPPLPVVVCSSGGQACGVVEDTRRAKRLLVAGEGELLVGHLSSFAFSCVKAAAELVENALSYAATHDVAAIFIPVPEQYSSTITSMLDSLGRRYTIASASVFAVGLPGGGPWIVNSSEI